MFKQYSFGYECDAKEDEKGPWILVRDHAEHTKSDIEFYQTQMKSLDARVNDLEEFVKDVCSTIDVPKSQISKITEYQLDEIIVKNRKFAEFKIL